MISILYLKNADVLRRQQRFLRMQLCASVFLLQFFFNSFTALCQTCGVNWNSAIPISSDSVLSNRPQITASGDTIHIVWLGFDTLGTAGNDGIQYSRSTDGGRTFSTQITLLPFESASSPPIIACSHEIVFVSTFASIDTFTGTVVLRSTDGGTTWLSPQKLLRRARPIAIASKDSSTYIHFSNPSSRPPSFGLFASLDGGKTWSTSTTAMPRLSSIAIGNNILYGIGSPKVGFNIEEVGYYASSVPGTSWFGPEILSKEDTIASLRPKLTINEQANLFAVWSELGKIIFRRSKNEGLTWTKEQVLSSDTTGIFSDVAASQEFVSVIWDNDFGNGGGIRFRNSNDNGISFCPVNSPTDSTLVGDPEITITENHVHAVWSESISGNVEIVYRNGILTENPDLVTKPPKEYALKQNYPNPFNGSTHIHYDLPAAAHAKLVVYNILGQKIAMLVDEDQSRDRYDVVFNAGDLPSGVYFYRLQTESFSVVRKFLLVR